MLKVFLLFEDVKWVNLAIFYKDGIGSIIYHTTFGSSVHQYFFADGGNHCGYLHFCSWVRKLTGLKKIELLLKDELLGLKESVEKKIFFRAEGEGSMMH